MRLCDQLKQREHFMVFDPTTDRLRVRRATHKATPPINIIQNTRVLQVLIIATICSAHLHVDRIFQDILVYIDTSNPRVCYSQLHNDRHLNMGASDSLMCLGTEHFINK